MVTSIMGLHSTSSQTGTRWTEAHLWDGHLTRIHILPRHETRDLPPSSAPMAIEFQRLGTVLRWSECQAIVKNAVWLKIGRRSKQNLDSQVLSATILNEVGR